MRLKLATAFSVMLLVTVTITLHVGEASAQTILSQKEMTSSNLEQKFFARSNTVVVYPIFTQAAYGEGGFYYYYGKHCDSKCLTVPLPLKPFGKYVSSGESYLLFSSLGADVITDVDVDKNPSILKQYENVVVLHNEYVTKAEFKAITTHPNVIYLYPNAMYAEVKVNYGTNQITLVRGHEYPDPTISNGFGWKLDNSKFEYNTGCTSWNFYRVTNGWMLNCYPEMVIFHDKSILNSLLNILSES